MSTRATGTMELKSWEEQPFSEIDEGRKLTRAHVITAFQGEIEGEGTKEYLMVYHDDDSAGFVGLERVVGSVGGRSGSFVVQHDGTFEGGTARAALSVVPGSGTGGLRGLRGEGEFVWPHGQPGSFTLDYDVE